MSYSGWKLPDSTTHQCDGDLTTISAESCTESISTSFPLPILDLLLASLKLFRKPQPSAGLGLNKGNAYHQA
jgi:hypothetical protein